MMNIFFKYTFILLFILGIGYEIRAQVPGVPTQSFRPAPTPSVRPTLSSPVKAQTRVNKLEAVKENFLSNQLKLTPAEADKFLPLYRKYQQEMVAVRKLRRLNNSDATANGTDQINKEFYYESQLDNIRKHYRDEFLKILPPEKVSELYKSERQFNDEMIKQLSERSERAGNY